MNLNANNNSNLTKSNSLPSISTINHNNNNNNHFPTTKSTEDALYKKVTDRLQQYNVSISGDMDRLLLQNRQLNEGEMSIEQEFRALTDIKDRIIHNNAVLEKKSQEIDEITEKVNSMPDVQVDEAICGTTVVSNQ
jgi:ESCRT-I complex subunit TSG101